MNLPQASNLLLTFKSDNMVSPGNAAMHSSERDLDMSEKRIGWKNRRHTTEAGQWELANYYQ